jgi:UDP-N-acetyl-2-amino-2-deoxyglucuronate dehydrogenase
MERLKLGLLGCGAIARFHLDGIKERVPRIDVTAVIDRDPERAQVFADATDATVYTSLEEALEEGDFDAVDIMLPHDFHETAALECFDAGKHVMLEKPMAPTLEACDRILKAAAETDLVFMVGENSQYWPEIVKAKEAIDEGLIGEVITARAAYVAEFDEYWFKEGHDWRLSQKKTGGGVTVDGGSHWIRPLRMWMGEIEEVVGILGYPLKQMEGESLMRSIVRFQSGKSAILDAMMIDTVFAPDPWWRITGSKGELTIDAGFSGGIKLWDKDNRDGKQLMEPEGYPRSFGHELADFTSAVLDGTSLAAGPEMALGELRTAHAIYRSAEHGRWEKVWE